MYDGPLSTGKHQEHALEIKNASRTQTEQRDASSETLLRNPNPTALLYTPLELRGYG